MSDDNRSNNIEDDGSQGFLDTLVHQRIRNGRKVYQDNSSDAFSNYRKLLQYNGHNKTITTAGANGAPQQSIEERIQALDPLGKHYVNRYTHSPHFGAAHFRGQRVDRETEMNHQVNFDEQDLNLYARKLHEMKLQSGNSAFSAEEQLNYVPTQVRQQVMGIYNRLQNNQSPFPQHSLARLHEVGNGNLMMNNNNGNGMAQPRGQQFSDDASQGAQGCKVMEGFPAYHPIQSQGFGGAVPLVRAVGMTNSAISMQQFIVRGTVRAFVVPPNQKVVDMAMLQTRPDLLCELVELQAPPMSSLGNILVPKEAIARMAQQGMPAYGNKHLLGDSRAGIRPGQNMGGNRIVTGNGNGMAGKRILTG